MQLSFQHKHTNMSATPLSVSNQLLIIFKQDLRRRTNRHRFRADDVSDIGVGEARQNGQTGSAQVHPNPSPLQWCGPSHSRYACSGCIHSAWIEIRDGQRERGLSLMERSPAVLQLLGVVRANAAAANERPGEEIALEDVEQVTTRMEIF